MDINAIMEELSQHTQIKKDVVTAIGGLTDQLKMYIINYEMDTLTGSKRKATYKTVTSFRMIQPH